MLTKVARVIRGISLGIWLGAGVMTFIAAHYVFRGAFVNMTTAGDIMGAILHAAGWMKLGLAVLALSAHAALCRDPVKPRKFGFAMLVLATLLAMFVTLYLEPKMVELRGQFRGDPNLENPAHVLFGKLHGASMGLATLELIFVAAALICALL